MVTDGNYIHHGEHFMMYINVQSSETNLILCQLYVNKKKFFKYINLKER